jgi:hypothetical protein
MPAALLTTPLDVVKTRIQATRISTGDWKINKELKVCVCVCAAWRGVASM